MLGAVNEILGYLSYLLGAAVVSECLVKGARGYSRIPFYIALAIIIVGPVEDLANFFIEKIRTGSREKELYKELVNQLTSIAFLVLMERVVREI